MEKRKAIAKGTAIAGLAVIVLAGAAGIYYYTMTPTPTRTLTSSITTSIPASTTTSTNSSSGAGPSGGNCLRNAQNQCETPEGTWAQYLGYIPSGYVLAPHYPIAPDYSCPPGMNPSQCSLFKASCGNGVCDPNESCATCPIDCGVPGQLTCDPYTGRTGGPVSVCQLGGNG